MDNKPSLADQPQRIRMDLPTHVAEALARLALREDRTTASQAVKFIKEGLVRAVPDYYARLAAARGIALPAAPAADGAVEPAGLLAAVEAFTRSVDIQTQRLDRLWERMGDLIERLDAQQPLNREDAQVMAEGLADGIGASLAGAISDLADALRRPSPAGRGERA